MTSLSCQLTRGDVQRSWMQTSIIPGLSPCWVTNTWNPQERPHQQIQEASDQLLTVIRKTRSGQLQATLALAPRRHHTLFVWFTKNTPEQLPPQTNCQQHQPSYIRHCKKYLVTVLAKLFGCTPHHIQNSKDFMDKISGISMQHDETVVSYDVTSLFTCLETARKQLSHDPILKDRTQFNPDQVSTLSEKCKLHRTLEHN